MSGSFYCEDRLLPGHKKCVYCEGMELDAEIAALKAELSHALDMGAQRAIAAESQLAASQAENEALKADVKRLQGLVDGSMPAMAKETWDDLQAERDSLAAQLAELKTPLKDWDRKIAEKNAALTERNERITELESKLSSLLAPTGERDTDRALFLADEENENSISSGKSFNSSGLAKMVLAKAYRQERARRVELENTVRRYTKDALVEENVKQYRRAEKAEQSLRESEAKAERLGDILKEKDRALVEVGRAAEAGLSWYKIQEIASAGWSIDISDALSSTPAATEKPLCG